MSQTKGQSALESAIGTIFSYVVSCLMYYVFFGPSSKNWLVGLYFVAQSFMIRYVVRRGFNQT